VIAALRWAILIAGAHRGTDNRSFCLNTGGSELGMRSRAEECRRKAEECFRLAKRARDPKAKEKYVKLAQQWLALAQQILQKK
jgi:hypothetical protein